MFTLNEIFHIDSDSPGGRRMLRERARQEAMAVFDRVIAEARSRRIWAAITRRSRSLCRLDVAGRHAPGSRRLPGVQTVPLAQIVGSENRAHDFDRSFAPLREHTRERWVSIAVLWYEGRYLPPVELVQIGNEYYVIDGHHRISVAKAFGDTTIEAYVTTSAPIQPANQTPASMA